MRGEGYLACGPRNTGIERQICALEKDKESIKDWRYRRFTLHQCEVVIPKLPRCCPTYGGGRWICQWEDSQLRNPQTSFRLLPAYLTTFPNLTRPYWSGLAIFQICLETRCCCISRGVGYPEWL